MSSAPRPGVLFDRDGVINVPPPPEKRYVTTPDEFHLMPGIAGAVALLNQWGIPVGVVTNQKCVAIGRVTLPMLERIHIRMRDLLAEAGAHVDTIQFCPHSEKDHCTCRKPLPGMLFQAADSLNLDLTASWLIGDQARDIEAGHAAGCHTLRVGPQADGSAGEEVFLSNTLDLAVWIREKSGFGKKESCQGMG